MGIECENGGYKYKAFFNGEWHDLTLSDSPDELTEWLKSNEEWARVKHTHWVIERGETVMHCNSCGWAYEYYGGLEEEWNYCPHCGAKMEESEK